MRKNIMAESILTFFVKCGKIPFFSRLLSKFNIFDVEILDSNHKSIAQRASGSAIEYTLNNTPLSTDQLIGLDDPTGSWELNRMPVSAIASLAVAGLGSAADRDAEDTLTYGSNLPDGVAITEYVSVGTTFNIISPADDVWLGKLATAVAGETLSGKQWAPLYLKDTGTGSRYYLYDADAADADDYKPIALLWGSAVYAAGDSITITSGDGVLAKDDWANTTATAAHVGTAVYCTTTAGVVDFTRPTSGHAKQIGTLLNIAANGRDVWDISFRYLDWTV